MKLVDYYPELLRDIYDKIEDLLVERARYRDAAETVDIAWETTEWIRANWSGRYLIRAWWGHADSRSTGPESGELPEMIIQVDPLKTIRGRELRDVIFAIVIRSSVERPCYLALAIAALVESEWSTKKVYVPFSTAVDRAIRDHAVWKDFSGFGSIERVVAKHGVSQSAIYDAYRRVQKAKKEYEEPPLPGIL